jgi:hypothetical protein
MCHSSRVVPATAQVGRARLATRPHPRQASAPHSPPAAARGPRVPGRHRLSTPGSVRRCALPRDPHTPVPHPAPAPRPKPLPCRRHRPEGCLGPEVRRCERRAGGRVALLPPAPRGPSAAQPTRPAQPSPRGATPPSAGSACSLQSASRFPLPSLCATLSAV